MSHYYQNSEAQDALAVIAKWMSNDKKLKVNYHNGTAVNADIFEGVINIPKLATSSGITDDTLTILRGRVYHEAGHIFDKLTLKKIKDNGNYPNGILFEIWNAVEDMRMERDVSERFAGAGSIFTWNNNYHNVKIAESVADGKEHGAIWEALVAMMFQSSGSSPKWRLSDKAQKYFDTAYDTFAKWKNTKNSFDTRDLADEIFEILKETHEDNKKEEEKEDENNQENNSDENEENQDEQEQDETEEDSGQGEGDNEESDEEDDNSPEQSGSGDFDDEEENDDSAGSENSDEEGQEEETDSKGSGDDAEESDEDSEEGDSQDEWSETGEYEYTFDDHFDKDELTEEEILAKVIKELEEQLEGLSLEDLQDADIEKALEDLDYEDAEYLSDKSNDIHMEIKPRDKDAAGYKKTREQLSATVAAMTSALQQALISRARCQFNPYQLKGKIDNRRLVHIAKNLSKEVFYTIKDGEQINTVVEIIIDESLSMGHGHVLPVRQIALAVAEVLTQLDIPFEITGTTTTGDGVNNGLDRTRPMVFKHYKTFDQQWSQVKTAIMQTGAIDNNVDGEAIEYCAARLAGRPEARKVILSLSDGEPYNGQTPQWKLQQHLIRTCKKVRASGIEVYGFGIDTEAPKEYYGEDFFIYLKAGNIDVSFTKAFVDIVAGGKLYA